MSPRSSRTAAARAALLTLSLLAPLGACAQFPDRVAGPSMAGAPDPVGSSHYDGGPDPYNVRPSAGLSGIGG